MALDYSSLCDQSPRKVIWIERAQVLKGLADADQLDRQAQFAGDRQRDSATRGAVQLGQHNSRDLSTAWANSRA